MKLRINAKLRAALIAAVSVVGFTITSAQAADITLANVMNQKADTPIIWGENGLDLTSVTASCSTTNVRTNNAYENSFRAVDTNVGNGASWTYTLQFTTGADTNATLSSVTADLLTFNGQNYPHNTTNYVNVNWTLSGGGQNLNGSSNNAELTFRSSANQTTAAYASDGHGGYVTSDQSHYCGGTVAFDFDDFALTSNTTYTLTVAVSRETTTGFFVGIGNVALINTPVVVTSTWNGTEGHSTWSDSNAWSDTPFVDGGAAVFDGTADIKTATVTSNVSADSVTVSGTAHTFELAGGNLTTGKLTVGDGGSLELTGEGTVAATAIDASGKTITINEGVVLTGAGSGTLAGEGKYIASSASDVLAGLDTDQTGWSGTIDATVVGNGTNLLNLLTSTSIHGGTVQLQSKGSVVSPGGTETSLETSLAGSGRTGDFTLAAATFTTGGALRFNDYSNNHVWTVGSGSGLQVGGDLWMDHGNKLAIGGGSVTVGGKLLLGHSGGSNPTGLVMSGGSLKAATLDAYSNSNAAGKHIPVSITGGTVEFTTTGNALQIHNNAVCDVTVGGSDSEYVTLKADSNSWMLAYNGMTIGNVAAQTAEGKTITLGATGMTANYTGGLSIAGGSSLKLDGTIARGTTGSIAVSGALTLTDSVVFDLANFAYTGESATGTYTIFTGSAVDLASHNYTVANITGVDTTGKVWTFNNNGTITWTLPSELEWDNTTGNNKWSYSDENWHGSAFVENATAKFHQDATAEVSGDVVANAIVVGNGEAAANVTVSAAEASTLTASTLQVNNGSLTTNMTIGGLTVTNVAEGASWNIGGMQTINEGTHAGTITVLRGGTVVLSNAAESAALLQSITGEGNITLKVDTDLAGTTAQEDQPRTQATGTLTIDHCQLKLGKLETGGAFSDYYVDLSSFKGVTLDNGTLWVHTAPLTVNGVKVVNGTSTIHIQDKSNKDMEYLTLAGTTTIDANSTLKFVGAWKGQTGIELLAGEGTLELAGPNETAKYHIDGGSIGKIIVSSGVVSATATNITTGALQMTAGTLAVGGTSSLGAVNIGPGTLTINSGATVAATSLSIADNKKATLNINGSLDVSGKFYAIGCTNTTDIIGSGEGSSLTVGSLDICNVGTNFNLRNITMTVKGKANAGDSHNKNDTHIDLNAGSALNLLGAVTFNTSDSKYCTLNVNGGALTAGADEVDMVTREFQNIAAGTSGGTVDFLNGSNTVANLDMTAGNLAVTVGEHAYLTLAAGTLKSAIANEGVLTLHGAIGLDNIGEEWVTTNPHGYEGSVDTENNGFVASALTSVTFATGDGSVILGEGVEAAMTYKGYHGTVTEGVFSVLQDAPDHSTYHLNSATEERLATAISVGGTDLNLVIMNAGTNLSATGVEATVDTLRINTTGGDAATLTAGTASFTHLIGEGEVDVAAGTTLTAANITVAQGKELTIGGEGALHGVTAINGAGTTHVDAAGVTGGALAISGGGTTTFGAGETISLEGLNISGDGTTVTFNSLVTVTGDARPSVGYENPNTSGATVTFNAGFEYNGTNGYGLLLGNGNTAYLGGTTDLSDKNVGISATGKIVLNEGADVKFGRVINTSSNNNNNGIVEVADGAVLATVANAANYITTLTNAGEVTFGGSATIVTLNNSSELAFGKSASVANLDNSGALTASGNITVTDSYANTGSITVVGSKLSVNNSAESLDLGNIVLDNGELNINYGGEGRVRDIESLAIAGNSKLTQTSWNNFMHIGAINDVDDSQPGSFTWEMKTNHWSNSVLYLTEAGDFSGTFTAKRTAHSGDNGAYQGYVQIDNADALQNAVLNVVGYQNNADVDYMSVALHTPTVETAGLSGNAQAIVFAGVADNTTGSGDNKRGQIAPSSDGTSTLVLDVAEDADLTYSGAVLEGISLQKDGAGAQTFNGDMSRFNGSVTVNDGTLTLGGDNTYTYSGPTMVNGGKLVVEGVLANSEITVGREGTVENKGSGALTLADVDVQLTRIENISGTEMTMKNAEGVLSLEELTIGAGSTVSFYDKADAPAEGTITVTETLTAGGGVLLANLVMADGATLDVDGGDAKALTLGSVFTIAEGAIVTLDNDTLAAIASLENIGDKVILVKQYQDHELTTNLQDGDWSRTHFDLSTITDADYKLFVTDSQIGLVK